MLKYFSYASLLEVQVCKEYLMIHSVRIAGIPANNCTKYYPAVQNSKTKNNL